MGIVTNKGGANSALAVPADAFAAELPSSEPIAAAKPGSPACGPLDGCSNIFDHKRPASWDNPDTIANAYPSGKWGKIFGVDGFEYNTTFNSHDLNIRFFLDDGGVSFKTVTYQLFEAFSDFETPVSPYFISCSVK